MKKATSRTIDNLKFHKRVLKGYLLHLPTLIKYLLFVCLALIYMPVFSQLKNTKSADVLVSNIGIKKDRLSIPANLDAEYQSAPNASSALNCSVLKVYYCSTTIYDQSQIIFIDSTRFFCYYVGCMSKFYSAGYYKKHYNNVTLTPNANVAEQLKRFITLKTDKTMYQSLDDTLFQIKGTMLISTKK